MKWFKQTGKVQMCINAQYVYKYWKYSILNQKFYLKKFKHF